MKTTIGKLKRLIKEGLDDDPEAQVAAYNARKQAALEDPKNKPFIDAIRNARDPKELARAKRALLKADDAGEIHISPGFWMSVYDAKKQELADIRDDERRLADPGKASADARMDRLLRMRDSSGKATPRKF